MLLTCTNRTLSAGDHLYDMEEVHVPNFSPCSHNPWLQSLVCNSVSQSCRVVLYENSNFAAKWRGGSYINNLIVLGFTVFQTVY